MIDELVEVLYRPRIKNKYGITEADIRELIVLIEERTEYVLLSEDIKNFMLHLPHGYC